MQADPAVPAYSIPSHPPAAEVVPDPGTRLDGGLFALAVVCMAVTASLDNLRGPMLPLLGTRLNLSYGATASFVSAVSLGALLMMMGSTRLLLAWPQRRFLALSSVFQGLAAFCVVGAASLVPLLGAGVVWGAGNAGVGLSANLYAIAASPARTRGRVMSALHVCYGVFASLPAFYLPWAAARAPFGPALLAPFAFLAVPVAVAYRRPREVHSHEESGGRRGGFGLDAWLLVAGLSIYVLGEVALSTWAATYLVARGHSLESAGKVLAGFFIGLAAGRGLVAWLLQPWAERLLPIAGIVAGGACFAAVLAGWDWGIALSGFALAPVFPLSATILVADYPNRYRQLLAIEYTVMMTLLLLGQQSFGWLSDAFGVQAAYRAPLACFAIAGGCLAAREFGRLAD